MDSGFEKNRILIGRGMMSEVYKWNGFAYKCFGEGYPDSWIEYEMTVQETVVKTGLPVVGYFKSEFPRSIKMELIDGITLADRIREEKYKNGLEDLFGLFGSVHTVKDVSLPPLAPFLRQSISCLEYEESKKNRALTYLSGIEDGCTLCHLDFHFLNIIYSQSGYRIIDWLSAKSGNPMLDYARSYVIMYEFARGFAGRFLKTAEKENGYPHAVFLKAVYVMALHRLSEYRSEKISGLADKIAAEIDITITE